jgi:hypothetical protein
LTDKGGLSWHRQTKREKLDVDAAGVKYYNDIEAEVEEIILVRANERYIQSTSQKV